MRRLVKTLIAVLVFCVILILILSKIWAAYAVQDRPLNPEAKAFFARDPLKLDSNFFIACVGLNAPPDEKNTYNYGLNVTTGKIPPVNTSNFKFDDETSHICFKQNDLNGKNCTTLADIKKLTQENEIFISRYETIYQTKFSNYSVGDRFAFPGLYLQDFINLQKILNAQWIEQAKDGHGKEAMDQWLLSTESEKRVFAGKMNMVEYAIWAVIYGFNLKVLPVILNEDPSLIPVYKNKIISVLDFDFIKLWNISDMERAEFNWQYDLLNSPEAKHNVALRPNDAQNKFLEFSKDMIDLANKPIQIMPAEESRLIRKYDCSSRWTQIAIKCLIYDSVANIMISAMPKGGQLFENAYKHTADQRALILWIDAKSEKIPASQMSKFLSNADSSLYDPFTNQPFKWDTDKHSIYYEWQSHPEDLQY